MTKDDKTGLAPELWMRRSVAETQAIYTDWATRYEQEVSARGYRTPERMARGLAQHLARDPRPVLDYGCGTGLSGLALRGAGLGPLHGTDINAAMIAEARPKEIYDHLWVSDPGAPPGPPGTYRAIVATGVISLGAAPPEAMDALIAALAPGDLLAMSFNAPTIADGSYDAQLDSHLNAGALDLIARESGPHIEDVGMTSDVIILRRT